MQCLLAKWLIFILVRPHSTILDRSCIRADRIARFRFSSWTAPIVSDCDMISRIRARQYTRNRLSISPRYYLTKGRGVRVRAVSGRPKTIKYNLYRVNRPTPLGFLLLWGLSWGWGAASGSASAGGVEAENGTELDRITLVTSQYTVTDEQVEV